MMPTESSPRNNDLALIHIAKAQLGIPDDQYRELLWTLGRVKSSKDLDWAGRQRLIEHFKKCGWAPKAKPGKTSTRGAGQDAAGEWTFVFRLPADHQRTLKRIYRLCQEIGARQSPPLPVMPKAWAEGILRQMRGHNAARYRPSEIANPLEMSSADELRALMQALDIELKRREARG